MKLNNTKQYYMDLAHYYFKEGRVHLMSHFRGLAENYGNKHTFSKEDTFDWFEHSGIARPEQDGDGHYL